MALLTPAIVVWDFMVHTDNQGQDNFVNASECSNIKCTQLNNQLSIHQV